MANSFCNEKYWQSCRTKCKYFGGNFGTEMGLNFVYNSFKSDDLREGVEKTATQ